MGCLVSKLGENGSVTPTRPLRYETPAGETGASRSMRSLDRLRVGLKKDGSLSNRFSVRDEADCSAIVNGRCAWWNVIELGRTAAPRRRESVSMDRLMD